MELLGELQGQWRDRHSGRSKQMVDIRDSNTERHDHPSWRKQEQPLLQIDKLNVDLAVSRGKTVPVLENVSLEIGKGEIVGVVGESGCGKSILSLSVLGLLPSSMRAASGKLWYRGAESGQGGQLERQPLPLHEFNNRKLQAVRGKEIAMIFQDPMSSLNHGLTIGYQMMEGLRLHLGCSRKEAKERALQLLHKVGLPRPVRLLHEYPYQLSGGMRQRVMIAMAIACQPGLLIADEPTTALDVTIQAQILELMRRIREEDGTAIMLISHDLGMMSRMCDRIVVMYAGQVVEQGTAADIFERPLHPYTIGLLHSIPSPDKKGKPLYSIPGTVPALHERGEGCRFASRCSSVTARCLAVQPVLTEAYGSNDQHAAACFLLEKGAGEQNEHTNEHAVV
ncbi:ABC transporter ATP-binding protein [Paenibacillus sp. CAU 1782]